MISFLGTLPLGTLNIAAMQLSYTDGIGAALQFSLGCLLVEVIYVRVSLVSMKWVSRQRRLFKWLEWITLLIIVALAVASFITAADEARVRNPILSHTLPRFLLGVAMSAVNPVQIPFWFGWSTILFSRGILQTRNRDYNLYILGIGIGTFIGNGVFIFGGRFLASRLEERQSLLQYLIAGIYALTALIQLIRMLQGKGISGKLDNRPEPSPEQNPEDNGNA